MAHMIAAFLYFLGLTTSTNPHAQMVDRVSASVVRITGVQHIDLPIVCTGFVIARQRVLTAHHCLGDQMRADGYPATILDIDEYYDLMVLGVPETRKRALVLRPEPVEPFERLTKIGYAWGGTKLVALTGEALLVDCACIPDRPPGIFTGGSGIGGMSGGPVVDAAGQVVGINQLSNDGIAYGVGTTLIHAFLLGTR